MNEEQQRVEIAKACGWEWKSNEDGGVKFWSNGDILYAWKDTQLPDYLNDLNQWQSIERNLSQHERETYQEILIRLSQCPFEAIHATAAQRAEAFLRTINKWKDTP